MPEEETLQEDLLADQHESSPGENFTAINVFAPLQPTEAPPAHFGERLSPFSYVMNSVEAGLGEDSGTQRHGHHRETQEEQTRPDMHFEYGMRYTQDTGQESSGTVDDSALSAEIAVSEDDHGQATPGMGSSLSAEDSDKPDFDDISLGDLELDEDEEFIDEEDEDFIDEEDEGFIDEENEDLIDADEVNSIDETVEAGEALDEENSDASELADETLRANTPDDEELTELASTFDRQTVDKSELRRYLASLDDEETLESLEEESLAALDEEPVTLLHVPGSRKILQNTFLGLLNLLLVGTLALQYVDQHYLQLAGSARFAPYIPWVCRVIDCPPTEAEEIASLYSQEFLIRTHPEIENALELSFIFRNDADRNLPFPGLELSLSDNSNQVIANRLITPDEYLPAELQQFDSMPGKSSIQVKLELVDPSEEAVNYTMAFRAL